MRDSRFDLSNFNVVAYQDARRADARQWLNATFSHNERQLIQAASGRWLASGAQADAFLPVIAALAEEGTTSIVLGTFEARSALLECCTAFQEERAGNSTVRHEAAILFGESLGSETARIGASQAEAFNRATDLLESLYEWEAVRAFRETFLEACRIDGLSAHWVLDLVGLLADSDILRSSDGLTAYQEREDLLAADSDDSSAPTLVWRIRSPDFPLSLSANLALYLLLHLDLTKWIEAIDGIASVAAKKSIFFYLKVHEDRDLILDGLKQSPEVISSSSYTGSTAALLFLDAALRHVADLESSLATVVRGSITQDDEAEAQLSHFKDVEAPAWFRRVASEVLLRQDGMWLAIEFAAHVVDRERRRWNTTEWSLSLPALESTAIELKVAGATGNTIHKHWTDRYAKKPEVASGTSVNRNGADDGPLPYLIAAGALEAVPWMAPIIPTGSSPTTSWVWYMEVLKGGGQAVESHINPHAYIPDWFYGALSVLAARQPDCIASWHTAWDGLAEQRQRYRFDRQTDGEYAPSAHLIRTGRQLMFQLVERGDDALAQNLWSEMLRCTFELAYGGRPGKLGISEYEIAGMFAYAPKVFGANWELALNEARPILASNARLALVSALQLAKVAVDPGAIRAAFDRLGYALDDAIADIQVWRGHESFTAGDLAMQNLDEIEKLFGSP